LSTLHVFNPPSVFRIGCPCLFPDANDKRNSLCARLLRSSTMGGPRSSGLPFHHSLRMGKCSLFIRQNLVLCGQSPTHHLIIHLYCHNMVTKVSLGCHSRVGDGIRGNQGYQGERARFVEEGWRMWGSRIRLPRLHGAFQNKGEGRAQPWLLEVSPATLVNGQRGASRIIQGGPSCLGGFACLHEIAGQCLQHLPG
jgi:hypothetical protein